MTTPSQPSQGGPIESRRHSGEATHPENPYFIEPSLVTPMLKVKALETFPLTPQLWEARFYKGNDYFDSGTSEAIRRLEKEGIIPSTTLRIVTVFDKEADGNYALAVGLLEKNGSRNEVLDREIRTLQLAGFLNQDAVQRYEFICRGAYKQFRKHELAGLLARGYNIDDFELGVTSFKSGGHYTEGVSIGAGLKNNYRGIELAPSDYRGNPSAEDAQKLKDWFAGLKAEAISTNAKQQSSTT